MLVTVVAMCRDLFNFKQHVTSFQAFKYYTCENATCLSFAAFNSDWEFWELFRLLLLFLTLIDLFCMQNVCIHVIWVLCYFWFYFFHLGLWQLSFSSSLFHRSRSLHLLSIPCFVPKWGYQTIFWLEMLETPLSYFVKHVCTLRGS